MDELDLLVAAFGYVKSEAAEEEEPEEEEEEEEVEPEVASGAFPDNSMATDDDAETSDSRAPQGRKEWGLGGS